MGAPRSGSYWEERLSAHYNERGVGDIGLSRSYNSRLYDVRRRVFRRLVRHLPLSAAQTAVLDIGSGTGVYIEEWQRWGAREITGFDITQTAVEHLTRRFPAARFVKSDIGDPLPPSAPPARYEVISAFDVLFHIVEDERYDRAIGNIASFLSPGGWFLYSDNLVERPSRLSHYVSRTEGEIVSTLRRNGLEIRHRVPMFVLMNDPVRTRSRLLRRWFSMVYRIASRSEAWGRAAGAALYPLELAATRIVQAGPCTEVLLCQRV